MVGTAHIPYGDVVYVVTNYSASRSDRSAPITPGSDADDARFVPLGELGSLHLSDGLFEWLVDHGVVVGHRVVDDGRDDGALS
jgi:hypothetical protein